MKTSRFTITENNLNSSGEITRLLGRYEGLAGAMRVERKVTERWLVIDSSDGYALTGMILN